MRAPAHQRERLRLARDREQHVDLRGLGQRLVGEQEHALVVEVLGERVRRALDRAVGDRQADRQPPLLAQVEQPAASKMLPKTLANLSLPAETLVAGVVRDGELFVPGGADVRGVWGVRGGAAAGAGVRAVLRDAGRVRARAGRV